ncbi:hypothetical protein Tco_1467542, partial [Tanacetum coccineum]
TKVGGSMSRTHAWEEVIDKDCVLAPKEKGGLGVSSLYALNRALMFKWVWRFYSQNSSLWARVMKAIHGDDGIIGKDIKAWRSIGMHRLRKEKRSKGWSSYILYNMANEHVPSPATTRFDDHILLFNAWVLIGKALTASADVPSSFTVTTETTSTLPPPPPPPQQSTVHQDIELPAKVNKARVTMSSATSDVTYTSVYTDSEPGRAFWGADDEEISEGGIPRTPPVPQDEDEREPMFIQAHDPDYVPEPIYPEYIPLEDDHEFPAEEQPLPPIDSPTTESPGYVTESDPEEDPEEYEDDETEDGPVDYPMDGGDDGDDDDGDSSRDDARDEDEDEEDEEDEEEEEHLAPADSTTVIPADEPVFPPEGTEPVIPPPSTDITIGARITVRPQTSISLPPEAEGSALLCRGAPCLVLAPIAHSPTLPPIIWGGLTQTQTLRIASTQALIDAVTAALPPPSLPPLPPSLSIPSPVDRRDDIPESEQPPRKRPVDAEEEATGALPLAELHERDTQDLYALLEDAQDGRSRISQRVDMNSQRVDLLMGDRMTLQETVWMVEEEAYASREAWAPSIGLIQATHQELQTYRDHVYAHETYLHAHQTQLQLQSTLIQTQHQVHETRFHMQQTEIVALRETNRRRQDQMVETLRVIRDMRREMSDMQAELLALREQRRIARQSGPEARIPDHQEASGDADSHI